MCAVWLLQQCTPHTHITSHICPHSVHTHMHTQVTGVLDGNVTRVMCRLRAIGGSCSKAAVEEHLWSVSQSECPTSSCADVTSTHSLCVGHLPEPLWTLLVLGISTRWVMAIHTHCKHGNHIVRKEIPVLNGYHGNVLIICHT